MIRVLPLLAALLFAGAAQAAQLTVDCDRPQNSAQACSIQLSGQIEPGDADRLLAALRQPLAEGWQYRHLHLDSPGGDVYEAFRLERLIKMALLRTTTLRMASEYDRSFGTCVSACFLVWVAGTERFSASGRIGRDSRPYGLGLHRPVLTAQTLAGKSPTEVAAMHQEMTARIREFLRREQVPEAYIQKMLEHSSREVYWLAEESDNFALSGRAAWFEELLIARCHYDPAYDRAYEAAQGEELMRAVRAGRRYESNRVPGEQRYLEWKQEQNACENQMRRDAQSQLRVGLQPKQR